jgi:RNA polymerase sigma-70 factor (ECF subfamily)
MSAPRPRLRLHHNAEGPVRPETLLGRIASGDEAALTALYGQCAKRAFGLALRIVGDRQAAEEVVVDTFTQVWQRARSFQATRGDALAWVLGIARHRAIDRRRQNSAQKVLSHDDIADLALEVFARDAAPEDQSAAQERAKRVRAAALNLPRGQREALAAAFFAGLTHQEIASAQDLPLGTVKSRIRDGMLALKRALAGTVEEIS